MLSSIDTLIQNEHQYFTRLAGSQPISFRRQLKIRDRLIEHQSATQTHWTSIRVFPKLKLLQICGVFTLMVFFMTLEQVPDELNPFVSIFGKFRTAFAQQLTILSRP